MCKERIKILSKVSSGALSFCHDCCVYHLEFNNIYLELNSYEFKQLKDYVFNIDIDYWEHKFINSNAKRKIPIPSMQTNLVLMFNRQEMIELKLLFKEVQKDVFTTYLNSNEIDCTLILN